MIGKVIYHLLTADAALIALVPATSIYPIAINEDTPLPAIVYKPGKTEPEYTKDMWMKDTVPFDVALFHNDYALGQDITTLIRRALELKRGTYHSITVNTIYCDGISEESDGNGTFGFILSFHTEKTSY